MTITKWHYVVSWYYNDSNTGEIQNDRPTFCDSLTVYNTGIITWEFLIWGNQKVCEQIACD